MLLEKGAYKDMDICVMYVCVASTFWQSAKDRIGAIPLLAQEVR
jgi:hypothetical protein